MKGRKIIGTATLLVIVIVLWMLLSAAVWAFTATVKSESLADMAFLIANIAGLAFVPTYMASAHNTRRKLIGLVILIVAWELIAFTLSDFFFAESVRSTGRKSFRRGGWVDPFNEDLFQALNIIAFASLLILLGYRIFQSNEKNISK